MLALVAALVTAATAPQVVSRQPCAPMASLDAVRARMQRHGVRPSELPDAAEFARVRRTLRCERIIYLSDGLRVAGYLYSRADASKPQPVIVFARGGNRAFGALPHDFVFIFAPYLEAGYAVLAPQYRGSDGGEGRDEFGGADLDDLFNLRKLIPSLGGLDSSEVFLLGESRGGMMVLEALRRGIDVRAAAVNSAPTDLVTDPRLEEMRRGVYQPLIPDFARRERASLVERSAIYWPEALHTPLLILQGTADDRVLPSDATRLDAALTRTGAEHHLVLFPGDSHMVREHFREAAALELQWFARHAR